MHASVREMGRGSDEQAFPLVAREKTEVVVAHADDWMGFYVDGELHNEGDEGKLNLNALLAEIGFRRSELDIREVYVDEEWWAENGGELPEDLDDLVVGEEL